MYLNFFRGFRQTDIRKFLQNLKSPSIDPYGLLDMPKHQFQVSDLETILNTSHLTEEGVCRLEYARSRRFRPFTDVFLKYIDDGSVKIELKVSGVSFKKISELWNSMMILGHGQPVTGFCKVTDIFQWKDNIRTALHLWKCDNSTDVLLHVSTGFPRTILLLVHLQPGTLSV